MRTAAGPLASSTPISITISKYTTHTSTGAKMQRFSLFARLLQFSSPNLRPTRNSVRLAKSYPASPSPLAAAAPSYHQQQQAPAPFRPSTNSGLLYWCS